MSSSHSDSYNTENKPNFYAIIPADVRYCREIEPGAKLLYGEITALSNREGYCWATNRYFAEAYEVDERTIQRWLESLKKQNFISVQIDKTGFQTSRKIYIFKENITTRQNCHSRTTETSSSNDKNAPHNNTYNTTKKELLLPGEEVEVSQDSKVFAKRFHEKSKEFANKYGKSWIFPEKLILSLILEHNATYVADQASYLCNQQERALKEEIDGAKKKTPKIKKPQHCLILACKENWALSNHKEKE